MENLRAAIEKDLKDSLEGEFKISVELTDPDGNTQIYSANDATELLGGQVLYFSKKVDPATGENIIVNNPVVSLRISSLDRVPVAGEKWYIKIPVSPLAGAEKKSFVFSTDKSLEHFSDIGFIKIYPQQLLNESGPDVLS